MEPQNTTSLFSDLQVGENTKSQLSSMSSWATIMAIIGFSSTILGVFISFMAPKVPEGYEDFYEQYRASNSPSILGIIFTLAISFLINYFLFMFGRKTKAGVESLNQGDLNEGFRNLKTYFKILGILLIIFLGFFILMVFFGSLASI